MSWQTQELVIALIAVITGLWTMLWWWSARTAQRLARQAARPLTIWEKLCHAHDLTMSDRDRLSRVARTAGLTDRLMVFVDPRVLEQSAANDPESARLGLKLFGEAFASPK